MRLQMFFPKEKVEIEGIISTSSPIEYDEKKNIVLSRGVNKGEYDEIYEFLRDQNKMSSGNFTIFPKDEIARYMRFDSLAVLMRSSKSNALIGTIFSMIFPIRCSIVAGSFMSSESGSIESAGSVESTDGFEYTKDVIIKHGCTTFLNVHNKLRSHGLCMALIRELTKYGFENKIYCSYSLTSFPLSVKSFEVSAWYRPLNLARSIGLGFSYPNWNVPGDFLKNRTIYNTKMPKKYSCERVSNGKLEMALSFYCTMMENKKFVFMPDIIFFNKWIQEYATFLVTFDKKPVGLFSIGSVYCRMESGLDGKLALPLLYVSMSEHSIKVMKSMIFQANEREYDVLYMHGVGDMNPELLKSINAIETGPKSYFSLYNNSMTLIASDLYIPLF